MGSIRSALHHVRLLLLLALATASQLGSAAEGTAASPSAGGKETPPLFDQEAFRVCESEGYVALTMGRKAFWSKSTRADLRAIPGIGDFERDTIDELFREKERGKLGNHLAFASVKLQDCADREGLMLAVNEVERTTGCYAQLDVVFFLEASRENGQGRADAVARVRKIYTKAEPNLVPEGLLEKLAPLVYAGGSMDAARELSRQLFSSCVFPRDWTVWAARRGARVVLPPALQQSASPGVQPGPAAGTRPRAELSRRFVECAAAMTWRARALQELKVRDPAEEVRAVQHYLRAACSLTGFAGLIEEYQAQDEAQRRLFRQEVQKDQEEGLASFHKLQEATLEACAREDEGAVGTFRMLDAATRDDCSFRMKD